MARHLLDRLSGNVEREPEQPPGLLPGFISSVLDSQDRVPERTRTSTPGYLHVSSMIDMVCPRQYAILIREERPIYRSVTGGHRVMWNIGRSVEAHIRAQFLRATGRARVFGGWTCPCGETSRTGYYAPTVSCGVCQKRLSIYQEHPVWDHDAKLVGNPDMLVDYNGWIVVVEIKSMTAKQWDVLSGPLGNHIFQAGMYRHLLSLTGMKVHPSVVTIYCTKDFKFGSPYKEYTFDATAAERVHLFEEARDRARSMAEHTANGTLPPRERCETTGSKGAQSCPVVASCFNATGE